MVYATDPDFDPSNPGGPEGPGVGGGRHGSPPGGGSSGACPPGQVWDASTRHCVPISAVVRTAPPPPKGFTQPHGDTTPATRPDDWWHSGVNITSSPPPIVDDPAPVIDGSAGGNNLQNLPNRPPPTERTLAQNALNAAIAICYGPGPKGGDILCEPIVVGDSLVMAFGIGEGGPGGIQAVTKITIDGRDIGTAINSGQAGLALTPGTNYNIHLGTKTQTVDPILAAADPLHVTGWPGLAYVVIKFPPQTVATGNYDPSRVIFEVQGIKCLDPRVDLTTRVYTDNACLHEFDIMTNPTYGLGTAYANMDAAAGSATSSWAVAASDCEFTLARTAPPGAAPTLGSNLSGGLLSFATYVWTIAYIGASGIESLESAGSTPTTLGAFTKQVVNWNAGPAGTVAIKLYRNKSGALTTPRFLVAQFNNNTTVTFQDGLADFQLGPASTTFGHRFAMAMAIRDVLPATEWINTIRMHFMGYLAYNTGKYQVFVDKAKAASGITFTDQGSAANIIGLPSVRSKGLAQLPSKVVVTYTDSAMGYLPQTAESELAGVATRVEERRELALNLLGCPTFDQAQRLAIMNLNRSAADKEITWDATAEGVQPIPGDIVTMTSDIGLSATPVIVTDCQPDHVGMLWHFKGEFYDPAVYSDVVVTNPLPINPGVTPPIPVAVTGLADVSQPTYTSVNNGIPFILYYLRVAFDPSPALNVVRYRVRRGLMSDTWATMTDERVVPQGFQNFVPGGKIPVDFYPFIMERIDTDLTSVTGTFYEYKVIVRAETASGTQSADTMIQQSGSAFSSSAYGGPTSDFVIGQSSSPGVVQVNPLGGVSNFNIGGKGIAATLNLTNQPGARSHSTGQIITTSTLTALALDTNDWVKGSVWSVGANTRLTVGADGIGLWRISGQAAFQGGATGTFRGISIKKNGTTWLGRNIIGPTAAVVALPVSCEDYATAVTDYYEFYVNHDFGANLNIIGSDIGMSFGIAVKLY
jgi:hypothetical protein